ncbi:MAG: amidohydrolase family protein [Synergistaceae bacterium]|nr:amidohydrolase family protein [Synergistaceae bacterium]MBP9626615.1 amidohydrolase family protein [Synergistaceae bacterium]MBP9957988.1 amidohydrolase family protein [Synergistaceae bacterium]
MICEKQNEIGAQCVDLILKHATVVTMDAERRTLEDGAVAIDKGRIAGVGSTDEICRNFSGKEEMDCRRKLVMPGMIDAHGHAGHALFKTIGVDSRSHWMHIATPTYHHYTTDEYWYLEGRVAALERMKMGVTCGLSVISSAQRADDPVFGCNNAKAYAEVGIRGVVAVGPCNPPYPRKFSRWIDGKRVEKEISFEQTLEATEAVIETWDHQAGDTIRVFVAPFVLITSIFGSGASAADVAVDLSELDRLMMRRVREIASKYKTRIHTEAFGGMIRLAHRDENALLGDDVHIQHCTGISFEEAMILAETGTHVTSAPGYGQANGRCPIPELLGLGANVSIATDGNSPSTPFDLFQAMRKTQLLQQVLLHDPFVLPPGKLLEMVTINPAKAMGMDKDLGSLECGKKADVIILNMWQPHLVPNFMPVHRLVYEAVGNDVETVIVDGRIVMKDRKPLYVDENEVLESGQEEALRTVKRAGIEQHMIPPKTFWGAHGWLDEKRVDYSSLISRP